jgi:hypothetical protein
LAQDTLLVAIFKTTESGDVSVVRSGVVEDLRGEESDEEDFGVLEDGLPHGLLSDDIHDGQLSQVSQGEVSSLKSQTWGKENTGEMGPHIYSLFTSSQSLYT